MVSIDNMTYGRDEAGRKKLIADITKDLNDAKSAFGQINDINTVVKKYWQGADATKYLAQLKEKANAASKSCTKYITTVTNALNSDAKSFAALQDKNASGIK